MLVSYADWREICVLVGGDVTSQIPRSLPAPCWFRDASNSDQIKCLVSHVTGWVRRIHSSISQTDFYSNWNPQYNSPGIRWCNVFHHTAVWQPVISWSLCHRSRSHGECRDAQYLHSISDVERSSPGPAWAGSGLLVSSRCTPCHLDALKQTNCWW